MRRRWSRPCLRQHIFGGGEGSGSHFEPGSGAAHRRAVERESLEQMGKLPERIRINAW